MKSTSLSRAVNLLKQGEVVAFPTETVYGLGADAKNPTAVQKVFEIKGRPADNPLIIHIASFDMVYQFAEDVPEDADKLMKSFWPGPLTLIFSKKPETLDIITGGLETVALRWPKHPLSQQLIAMAGPLVAPSANSSGKPSPTKPEHVREDFGNDFPVIDAGETEIGLESTVLDVSKRPYTIYRPGAISAKEIENTIGQKIKVASGHRDDTTAKSPGTKYSHYAPNAEVSWLKPDDDLSSNDSLYLLHKRQEYADSKSVVHYDGDYRRMARELYDRFRQADHLGFKSIKIEPFNESLRQEPMVQALINRISKASA